MKEKYATITGILFFLAGIVILMGIITAEAYYPDQPVYTTHKSMISDLGSTMPPNSIITQPSATIFNLSMMITGILILVGTYFLFRFSGDRLAAVLFGLLGIGALGVGLFPGNVTPQHPIFALLTFVSGGLAAVYSFRIINSTFKFLTLLLGFVSLISISTYPMFEPMLGGRGN
jgi:Predicted membrane protein